MKKLGIIFFCLILASCSTVTISPPGGEKISSSPSYQESKNFFLFGLIGEPRVDTKSVCNGSQAVQMQSQSTFVNELITGLTFGLYAPHTVKVWCE
ncbi:MAG: Bor family protein [Pseudomonadales bacterium]|nr:Bor family protein [Pseudomonadales bacterium]